MEQFNHVCKCNKATEHVDYITSNITIVASSGGLPMGVRLYMLTH